MVTPTESADLKESNLKGNIPDGLTPDLLRYWEVLDQVPDPEIPAISVVDLGIVTRLTVGDGGVLQVVLKIGRAHV